MKRIFSIIVLLFCFSCTCKEETFYLSENEIALFPYENTSSVTFIDSNQDLVVFENIMYERDIYEESNSSSWVFPSSGCDDSYEEIQVSMSSDGEYDFSILITSFKYRVSIADRSSGGFGNYYELSESEYLSNYSFDGVIYDEVLKIYSEYHPSEVVLIKNIGVVEIRFGNSQNYLKEFILEN